MKRMVKKPTGFTKIPATVTIESSKRIPYEDDFAVRKYPGELSPEERARMRALGKKLALAAAYRAGPNVFPQVGDLCKAHHRRMAEALLNDSFTSRNKLVWSEAARAEDAWLEKFNLYNPQPQRRTPVITQDKRNAVAMKALGSLYLFEGEISLSDMETAICNNLRAVGYSEEEISFTEFANIRTILRKLLNALGK